MTKERFWCRIGIHNWQRVEESKHSRTSCWLDDSYGCVHPLWDKVCIAPGCRATKPTATNYKEREQRAKEVKAERDHLADLDVHQFNIDDNAEHDTKVPA